MSDPTGGRGPEELLSGLDRPRPLPSGLRARLEDQLVAPSAPPRPLEPDLAAALTEALSRPTFEDEEAAELLSGVDGSRALPAEMSSRLATRLQADGGRRRFGPMSRRWVGAGVAAAVLLAAGVTGVELRHSSHSRTTAASSAPPTSGALRPVAGTPNAVAGPSAAGSGAGTGATSASGAQAGAATAGGSSGIPSYSSGAGVPRISAVVPASGVASGGNTVTIDGSGFSRATAVRFGSTRSVHFVVVSEGLIRAVVPPHTTGTVFVVVVTPGGASPAGPASRYTYNS